MGSRANKKGENSRPRIKTYVGCCKASLLPLGGDRAWPVMPALNPRLSTSAARATSLADYENLLRADFDLHDFVFLGVFFGQSQPQDSLTVFGLDVGIFHAARQRNDPLKRAVMKL